MVVVVGAAGDAVGAPRRGGGCRGGAPPPTGTRGWARRCGPGSAHLEHGDADLALVTLVDLPDVTAEVVERVLAAARGDGRAALVRAAYGGVPGHPVALGRDHWAAVITTAHGDRGARDHLRATPHRLVECGDLATGRDLDTAGDLDDLRRG